MERPQYRQAGQIVRDEKPHARVRSNRHNQLYAVAFLVVGLLVRFGSGAIPPDFALGLSPIVGWWIINIISIGLWMTGSYFYAKALRIEPIWCLLGLLSFIGLIAMFVVSKMHNSPNRYKP
jgi:hypothetical protein